MTTLADRPDVSYLLADRGPNLYPAVGEGCFWCTARHDLDGRPQPPSACPVVYLRTGRNE